MFSSSHRKQTDPFSKHLKDTSDFLVEIFARGLEYSAINIHRSSILAFHKPIDRFSVGKNSKVCNLVTGVYDKRAPNPKHCIVWDI